jgi:hypothetical protein
MGLLEHGPRLCSLKEYPNWDFQRRKYGGDMTITLGWVQFDM